MRRGKPIWGERLQEFSLYQEPVTGDTVAGMQVSAAVPKQIFDDGPVHPINGTVGWVNDGPRGDPLCPMWRPDVEVVASKDKVYKGLQALAGQDEVVWQADLEVSVGQGCLLYTSPSPRDKRQSRMPSSA